MITILWSLSASLQPGAASPLAGGTAEAFTVCLCLDVFVTEDIVNVGALERAWRSPWVDLLMGCISLPDRTNNKHGVTHQHLLARVSEIFGGSYWIHKCLRSIFYSHVITSSSFWSFDSVTAASPDSQADNHRGQSAVCAGNYRACQREMMCGDAVPAERRPGNQAARKERRSRVKTRPQGDH